MLNAGSALGRGVGPLLITKMPYNLHDVDRLIVAIPGKYTSAHFLFETAFPEAHNKKLMHFADIEDAVLNDEVDAGVIIHENRFTYADKGLLKIIDLGEFWESKTGLAIPLGGIAIKRSIDPEIKRSFDSMLKRSIEFAYKNPDKGLDYIHQHAQEMDAEVLKMHIKTYVNEYSIDLGNTGKSAVYGLFHEKLGLNLENIQKLKLFV
jgi:1,4-dihydroxy-6-naphthoate synthase